MKDTDLIRYRIAMIRKRRQIAKLIKDEMKRRGMIFDEAIGKWVKPEEVEKSLDEGDLCFS